MMIIMARFVCHCLPKTIINISNFTYFFLPSQQTLSSNEKYPVNVAIYLFPRGVSGRGPIRSIPT